ncbi:uncharacterized protein G2W53_006550 [Senna tora]|uniref:Uncharacterized protein n=1 Tax=Senna tora TaxID=362788 RepID=A0A834X4I4_9FABA|nr:uncharacterized protein G2W53_006550 [Senna tora]
MLVNSTPTPTPTPWPEQFHALLYMNLSSTRLQLSDLWYDWPYGRNVNIFQRQLGDILYDIEWDNGTSYYYTLGQNASCEVKYFEVGIPRPDFMEEAEYLGTQVTDGFLCHVWEKVDFIWYYEDVLTRRPVRWDFYDESRGRDSDAEPITSLSLLESFCLRNPRAGAPVFIRHATRALSHTFFSMLQTHSDIDIDSCHLTRGFAGNIRLLL